MRSDVSELVWRWATDKPNTQSALACYRTRGLVILREETSDFGCTAPVPQLLF